MKSSYWIALLGLIAGLLVVSCSSGGGGDDDSGGATDDDTASVDDDANDDDTSPTDDDTSPADDDTFADDDAIDDDTGDDDTTLSNYALEFDGVNDYVDVANDVTLQLHTPVTIEAWFNAYSWTADRNWIIDKRDYVDSSNFNGWALELTAGKLEFHISHRVSGDPLDFFYVQSPNVVPTNQWIHAAATYDGAVMKLWMDGYEVNSTDTNYAIPVNNVVVRIGASSNDDYHWNGLIDEIRLSGVIRYTDTFTPEAEFSVDANTIALWHMDEGAGTAIADESTNHNDGIIYGASWFER